MIGLYIFGSVAVALIALGDRPRSQKIGMVIATGLIVSIIGLLVE